MKQIYIEAKSVEEAYRQAEMELKATRDQISFKIEEEKKLFSKSYKVTATLMPTYPMKGLEYLKAVLENLGIKAIVEMRKKQNREIRYVITSEENPILIGKGGKTLEAIQTLVRCIVNNDIDDPEKQYQIAVDCGGYKENRVKHLEILATKTAKDVAQSKIEARLEPMNSFERRIIHAKLADWRDVYTESEGEGKDRCVVIRPRIKTQKEEPKEIEE